MGVLGEVSIFRAQPHFIWASETVVRALLSLAWFQWDLLFLPFRDAPDTYRYVVSEPLGRNSYKERYLFVYR
jgi:hypothetical protein